MRPNPKLEQQLVDSWNSLNTVGCQVIVTMDDGSHLPTTTISDAWVMGGHSAVVKIAGISGAYSLKRVAAV